MFNLTLNDHLVSNTLVEADSGAPFTIQFYPGAPQPESNSHPEASILISPTLRTSGLLLALAPEDLKNLVFVLTFVSPEGICRPTVQELAQAMHVSEAKVHSRMERLCGMLWQGQPVVSAIGDSTTPDAYQPGPQILEPRQDNDLPMAPEPTEEAASQTVPDREATPAELREQLLLAGVTPDQTDLLIASYDSERIARQIEWLPYRKANNPPAFLVAAIEDDYDEPLVLRPTVQLWPPNSVRQDQEASNGPGGA